MKKTIVAILTLIAFSCQKEKAPVQQSLRSKSIDNAVNSPTQTVRSNVNTNTFTSNVDKVVQISYSNSLLTQLKRSPEWKKITTIYTLDLSDIKRAYLLSSPLTVITFAVKGRPQYFNVYIDKNNPGKFLITKMLQIANPSTGLTTYRVESPSGEFYYKLDINQKNQIGNWKFGTSMPTDVFSAVTSLTLKKFNDCMNNNIVEICGNNWMCTVACGVAIISCIAGSAACCLTVCN